MFPQVERECHEHTKRVILCTGVGEHFCHYYCKLEKLNPQRYGEYRMTKNINNTTNLTNKQDDENCNENREVDICV